MHACFPCFVRNWEPNMSSSFFTLRFAGSPEVGFYIASTNCVQRWWHFLLMWSPTLCGTWMTPCEAQLSYLVDILDSLNSLNTSMQGRDANILLLSDKVNVFVGKLDLWRDRLINTNVNMFPNFADCVQETGINISPLINTVAQHVEGLKQQFSRYFTEDFS